MGKYIYDVQKIVGLKRRELAVLKELAIFADKKNVAWPSNATLARRVGYGVRSLQLALEMLEDRGLILRRYQCARLPDGTIHNTGRTIDLLRDNWDKHMITSVANDYEIIDLTAADIKNGKLRAIKRGNL